MRLEILDSGLLHVVMRSTLFGIRVRDNATVLGGSIFGDASAQDDGLGALLLKELQHLAEREGAADVGVEDEEPRGAALEDGIAEMIEPAGGSKSLVLAEVLDAQGREGLGTVLQEGAEYVFLEIADQKHLADVRNAGYGAETVLDDGVAGDFEERLGA